MSAPLPPPAAPSDEQAAPSDEQAAPNDRQAPPNAWQATPTTWHPETWRPVPSHPRSSLALVLGIVSVVGSFVGITLVLGPLAWYFGASTMRAIDRDPLRWGGRGSAKAGLVMGIIATALLVGLLLLLLLITGLAATLTTVDTGY